MSDLAKINIYVPNSIATILDYDARMFEILKNDRQTINRNRFLSLAFLGYYDSFISKYQEAFSVINKELSAAGVEKKAIDEAAGAILRRVVLPDVPEREEKNSVKKSLKPTKETEGLLLRIMEDLGSDDSISQFLRRMLISYCEKPIFQRERIVFRDNYERLLDACKMKRTISFSTNRYPKDFHEVFPYKIVYGNEELFNYLLCAEINSNKCELETRSYRLCRINRLNYSSKQVHITDLVRSRLDRMASFAPQFAINSDEVICVKLTKKGVELYNKIYTSRPKYDHIEEYPDGKMYYFRCAEDQVYFYFRRFENDAAEILFPIELRQRIRNSFNKNARVYDE